MVMVLAACGPAARPTETASGEAPGYPTVLSDPSTLGDFAMQQEITIRHPEGENSFRAVLQKQGDTMILMVLAPHGGRAFVLTQTPAGVEYESFMPRELPFPPEYILYDVHRTWFVDAPIGVSERDGDRITSRVEGERLQERRFERLDGAPEGTITVRYEGGLAPGAPTRAEPPEVTVMENGWFGYTATVRTLQWQAL